MKKRKKVKVSKLFSKSLNCILMNKIRFYENSMNNFNNYIYYCKFINLRNKVLRNFFNKIIKNENTDIILPSTFKQYLKDATIKPFWNDTINVLSTKLFLPIIKNLNDNDNLSNLLRNSWFNSQKLDCKQKHIQKLNLFTDATPVNDDPLVKTRTVHLYPTSIQKIVLKRFIGMYRYYYNRTIEFFNNYNSKDRTSFFHVYPKDKTGRINITIAKTKTYISKGKEKTIDVSPYSMKTLRDYLKGNTPTWGIKDYPSHLVDQAINEACIAIKTNFNKYAKTGIAFRMSFKRRENVNTIKIDGVYISKKKNSIFPTFKLNKNTIFRNINANEEFYKYGQKMTNLSWDAINDRWKISIPIEDNRITNIPKYQIASIDPGIRKFGVLYSEDHIIKIGTDADQKIYKTCKEIDIIKSRMDRKSYYTNDRIYLNNSKRRRNLRRALHRKIGYLKNLKSELHWKTINYLCKNYKKVIYPHFETQKMASKLSSKTARNMYNLGFYQFKQRLINKCKKYGTSLYLRSEAYTSKTCTNCGSINNNLGTSEIFKCNSCKLVIDRDVNGARNILLKNNDCI